MTMPHDPTRRRAAALGAVGVLVTGLSGCTGASTPASTAPTSTSRFSGIAAATLIDNPPLPHPPVAGAKTGGILTVEQNGVPDHIDPTGQYQNDLERMLHLTHRALTAPTMLNGRSVLVPDLATDLGKRSQDGLTWTYTLRDGIKYSDGTPVKAADVVYAIKRSFALDVFTDAPTYNVDFFKGGTTYKGPWASKDADFQAASAPDDKTVVIHLARKFESLPYFVAFSQFSPIPQAKDGKDPFEYEKHMLSTGPYKVAEYVPGSTLKLVRNDQWDPKTDPARLAYVDGYLFRFKQDPVKSQAAILASNGDAATSLNWDGLHAEFVEKVQGQNAAQFVSGPGPCVTVVNLDTTKLPLDVRQAIAAAYPFDQIFKAAGGTSISDIRTSTLMPPQVPGHLDFTVSGLTGRGKGDPQRAHDILAAHDHVGFVLKYFYDSETPATVDANVQRKQALVAAGFTVQDQGLPKDKVMSMKKDPRSDQNMLMTPIAWCYDWPSGESIFRPTVSSGSTHGGRATNWGNLSDKAIDAELDRIANLPLDEQPRQWGKFDQWLLQTYLPVLPYAVSRGNDVFGTKVHNVINDPNRGMPVLDMIWLDQ